jgi:hypothetical protein
VLTPFIFRFFFFFFFKIFIYSLILAYAYLLADVDTDTLRAHLGISVISCPSRTLLLLREDGHVGAGIADLSSAVSEWPLNSSKGT